MNYQGWYIYKQPLSWGRHVWIAQRFGVTMRTDTQAGLKRMIENRLEDERQDTIKCKQLERGQQCQPKP